MALYQRHFHVARLTRLKIPPPAGQESIRISFKRQWLVKIMGIFEKYALLTV